MSDSPEKRQSWRLYKKTVGEHYEIVSLFQTLKTPPTNSDPKAIRAE